MISVHCIYQNDQLQNVCSCPTCKLPLHYTADHLENWHILLAVPGNTFNTWYVIRMYILYDNVSSYEKSQQTLIYSCEYP